MRKKKLTKDSSPEDWIGELPQDKKKPTDPRSVVTIADWTTYSNTKAMLCNAGMQGGNYPEFTPFSSQEINRFIVPNALQGLTPSPQVKMKFKSQVEDPVRGSDICHAAFGTNAEKKA